jgi:hypothetical protein
MNIQVFVENYKEKKFMNTKQGIDEKSEWLRKELEIKSYIPFREKRMIAEEVVKQHIEVVDGVKKYDSIDTYISFVMASIMVHTNLECSDDPVADYDLLAESGLLQNIVAEFQESHNEIDTLLKMIVAMELEDNNVNVLVGKFLNGILQRLDVVGGVLKDKLGDLNLKDILGRDINQEDLAKLQGFLNKYIK